MAKRLNTSILHAKDLFRWFTFELLKGFCIFRTTHTRDVHHPAVQLTLQHCLPGSERPFFCTYHAIHHGLELIVFIVQSSDVSSTMVDFCILFNSAFSPLLWLIFLLAKLVNMSVIEKALVLPMRALFKTGIDNALRGPKAKLAIRGATEVTMRRENMSPNSTRHPQQIWLKISTENPFLSALCPSTWHAKQGKKEQLTKLAANALFVALLPLRWPTWRKWTQTLCPKAVTFFCHTALCTMMTVWRRKRGSQHSRNRWMLGKKESL